MDHSVSANVHVEMPENRLLPSLSQNGDCTDDEVYLLDCSAKFKAKLIGELNKRSSGFANDLTCHHSSARSAEERPSDWTNEDRSDIAYGSSLQQFWVQFRGQRASQAQQWRLLNAAILTFSSTWHVGSHAEPEDAAMSKQGCKGTAGSAHTTGTRSTVVGVRCVLQAFYSRDNCQKASLKIEKCSIQTLLDMLKEESSVLKRFVHKSDSNERVLINRLKAYTLEIQGDALLTLDAQLSVHLSKDDSWTAFVKIFIHCLHLPELARFVGTVSTLEVPAISVGNGRKKQKCEAEKRQNDDQGDLQASLAHKLREANSSYQALIQSKADHTVQLNTRCPVSGPALTPCATNYQDVSEPYTAVLESTSPEIASYAQPTATNTIRSDDATTALQTSLYDSTGLPYMWQGGGEASTQGSAIVTGNPYDRSMAWQPPVGDSIWPWSIIQRGYSDSSSAVLFHVPSAYEGEDRNWF